MNPIHLVLIHEGEHWIPCVYMARVVESVAPDFGDDLRVEKIIIKQREGARRFREISASLGRPAPVPSIFIEGQLIFDQTPGPEELRDFLKGLLGRTS